MRSTFTLEANDHHGIFVRKWTVDHPKAIVQIIHGMNEHSERYTNFALFLNNNGYSVYATDHRGHGHSAVNADQIGYIGENGFNKMVSDEYTLFQHVKKEYPTSIHFILGHSMGSFITQRFIQLYGDKINGAILIGSGGDRIDAKMGELIASLFEKATGDKRSRMLEKLVFKGYNAHFDKRTRFEWLANEPSVVDGYLNDPFCGHVFPPSFYRQFLSFLQLVFKPESIKQVPSFLPLYILSGNDDPVGQFGKGIKRLYEQYSENGLTDVDYKLYPKGRHEILNDTDKMIVYQDVLSWLELHS